VSRPSSGRSLRRSGVRLCLGLGLLASAGSAWAATPAEVQLAQQLALAGTGAVKLVVRAQGWLRVGQPDLVAAGLPAGVDPAKLQLFADGVEQAILVTGNGDATFSADEAVEFYGVGRDTLWGDARTYWLVAGAAGARVPVLAPPAGGAAPTSFVHVQPLVEHKNYVAAILNGDESNFFSDAVAAAPVTKMIAATHLDAGAVGAATLRVSLQGATATPHQIDVSLDGQVLGTASLGKSAEATFIFSAPNLVEGANVVGLTSHGASDAVAIESLGLSYPHTYAADGDALVFTAPAATRVAVTGFSAAGVRVVDVTDGTRPIELTVTALGGGASNTARVDTPAGTGDRTLIAFLAANVGAPSAVVADAPSSWSSSHDGELVVISHASFMSAMAPLVARRRAEGWTVQLVDVQDVYDERGFGDKSVTALRDFIQSARTSWRVPPRFVLLVGDATFDPRNFLGLGDFDFVPTKLIDTTTMETASDDWFVDADLDGVPELAIGRMPVRTAAQAQAVVAKTLGWAGTGDLPRGGLFVTDVNDSDIDFETPSAVAETKVADIMPVDRFRRSDPASTSAALVAKLGAGPFLVNYLGHGSVEVWDGLLTSAQAAALTNEHASIYVIMNCLNGFFHDLYTTSMAESLLEAPQGGAVAVWASSTLADFTAQPGYNQEFLMRIGRTSLGETAIGAKQAIDDVEARRTWILFGDPTLLGKPGPGAGDGGVDAGASDAMGASDASGGAGAAGTGGAGAAGAAGMSAAGTSGAAGAGPQIDAGVPDATTDAAASADAGVAPSDAAAADGAGGSRLPAPPSNDGCGCSTDASSSRGAAGLGGLLLACAASLRRRRPRAARRGLVGLLTLALTWLAFAPSAHAAYGFRKALTIDRTRIGASGGATTLSSYPLLISTTDASLKSAANGGNVQSASGYDIAFKGADPTTCNGPSTCTFNYEIEAYDPTSGNLVAWVQIPVLKTTANTANTTIYLNYGDASVTTPTQNATGTWDANFRGVWHLNQNPTMTTEVDSTSAPANATSLGSPAATGATGLIGAGVNLGNPSGAGYLDYTSTKFNWTAADTFTYSGWFNTTDPNGPLLSQRDNGAGNPVIDIMLSYNGSSRTTMAGAPNVLVRDDTNGMYAQVTGTTPVNDGAWHLFALTRTGGTIQLFIDGVSVGSNTSAGASSIMTTGNPGSFQHIGKEGNWVFAGYGSASNDDRYLAGTFDEYRVSKTIRNADWITTDYKTQSAPASTFTAGAETLASCGDGTVGTGEACDDGNIVSGDGCSNTCTIETGYTCTGTTSICATTCGDGVVAGTEVCDDHNLTNGDGCTSACTIENLYHCSGTAPSVCAFAQFDFYKTLTVNKAQVGTATAPATLTNYPVLLSTTDPSLANIAQTGGRVRDPNGYDIIFRGEDTTICGGPSVCQLPHEIEKYDNVTGQLIAWILVPGLKTQTNTASTSFKMLIGNRAISTPSAVATSAWETSFKGVWHLHQTTTGTAPQMKDSTANGNDGTATSLTSTAAEIGTGVSMDGSTSFMSFNGGTSLNSATGGAFTYSTWIKVPVAETFGSIFSARSTTNSNVDIDFNIGRDGGGPNQAGKLLVIVRDDSNGTYNEVTSPRSINDNTWHYVTLTRNASTIQVYIDTTSQGSSNMTTLGTFTTNLRALGRESRWVQDNYTTTAEEYTQATFDELRYSATARTLDWITTDYNAQSSPGTFITYTMGAGGEVATDIHTDVSLVSFDAVATCAGTTVTWQTAYEIDTLGFNVYRVLGDARVKLNATLLPGAGLTGGGGHQYEIVDPAPLSEGPAYELETVHLDLDSTWDGPAAAHGSCLSAAPPPSTSLVSLAGAPTPLSASHDTAASNAADDLGGCSLAARHGGGASTLALAAALLALARRRRLNN
jgi:cysteine-rich repeat protein